MKISERIALIKAGYSKKEIAEIEAAEKEPEVPEPEVPEQEPEKEPEQEPDVKEPETEPDFKTLYEQAMQQLEAAQRVNINLTVKDTDDISDDERLTALITDLL